MNFDYNGRSSYFKVKDMAFLEKWANSVGGMSIEKGLDDTFCLFVEEPIGDEDQEGNPIMSLSEAGAHFLPDGEVVVFTYRYSEGQRYMGGGAFSFDNQGVIHEIHL